MTDKLQLVAKMNQSAANGHQGDNNGQTRGGKNEHRGNRSRNGGTRNREKGDSSNTVVEEDDGYRHQKGHRNTKKGRVMNDLANFQYYRPAPAKYNHRKTSKASSEVYKKEDYVHVSCQFVVKEGDWQSLTQIDSCVNWSDVIQVRLPCEELASCPICLYPPVCPLSPICGHSMCYTCALRFSDNCPGGDCPVCHKPLILSDFLPLKTYPSQSYKVGDEVVMKLVRRNRNGKIVCPVTEGDMCSNVPNLSSEWGAKFSNVVTASPSQVLQEVLLPQEEELKTQLALVEDEDKECEPYILRALSELQVKKDECFDEIEVGLGLKLNQSVEEEADTSADKKVYFYQCMDGQPIFIHPLNSRCLIHEYGSIEGSIPELTCKIIATEHYTQSPEMRSRYRYFSHLPLGCPFILCEVDVTPFIGEETFEHFKRDFDRRSKARQAKEQKENAYTTKLSKKLAEKEVNYNCSAYLPKYTEVSKPAGEHFKTAESYDLLEASRSSPTDSAPLSFAAKLCAGASKPTPWIKSSVSPERFRINSTSSDLSLDGEVAAPSFQHSFSASLNDAFASLEVAEPAGPAAPVKRSKKKKNKGKTISLTGGARRC